MSSLVTGALAGAGLGLVLIAIEYLMLRSAAVERAARKKVKPQFDDTERKRMRAIVGFSLWLPPALAGIFWLLG